MIPHEVSILARDHLTDIQRQVFMWHLRDGIPLRRIAIIRDVTHSTVQDCFDGACKRLRAQGVRFTPDGLPYLQMEENNNHGTP